MTEEWGFKILRSAAGKFSDPFWLKTALDEEGRAGWLYLEKFDDNRIRLKRPASARERDASLGFDPYRTWVGMSQARYGVLVAAAILAAVGVVAVGIIVTIAHFTGH
ncbi:MAG: hypothetical protein WCD20_21060 [Rhodomicrobium sp.]